MPPICPFIPTLFFQAVKYESTPRDKTFNVQRSMFDSKSARGLSDMTRKLEYE